MASSTYPPVLQDQAYGGFNNTNYPYPQGPAPPHGQTPDDKQPPEPYSHGQLHPQRQASDDAQHSDESTHGIASASANAASTGEAKARLRKACDSCSIRKVKCDEAGPPCRACTALEIPCTFERPSRRRGPPNRHAEAIKKRRLDSENQSSNYSHPASPTHAAQTLASFSQQQVLSADSICPPSLLHPLVDDYFTYIHPLIPIPHEPTFRESLQRRDDLQDPTFLSLLAAMIGALVVSFPRKPRLHLRAQHKESIFPSSMSFVERCHRIAVQARGSGFMDKDLNVYDAATSYLLGLTAAYAHKWRQSKLYCGECLLVLRSLNLHKASNAAHTPGEPPQQNFTDGQDPKINYITQEMGRRTFWVLFVGAKSLHQLGASYTELYIPPATASEQYPPFPLEVDDDYIFRDRILPQPAGVIANTVGFNANVRIFCSYNALATIDMVYGMDSCVDWDRQKHIVKHCLMKCKLCLDGVPRELMLRPGRAPGDYGSSCGDSSGVEADGRYLDGSSVNQSLLIGAASSPQYRRSIQYEIQKANIYVTQLGTRSHILEKYWALCERKQRQTSNSNTNTSIGLNSSTSDPRNPHTNGGGSNSIKRDPMSPHLGNETMELAFQSAGAPLFEFDETEMAIEREEIVRDLLVVLGTISQVNMEPNGGSLILKIRLIAATLLEVPRTRKGALALSAEQCLATFLDVLMKLERSGDNYSASNSDGGMRSPSSTGGEGVNMAGESGWQEFDEEAELRNWADLREYQTKFAEAGGVLSEL